MRPFSFTTISRSQHIAVKRWLKVSILLMSACFCMLICVGIPEYILNKKLLAQHQELRQIIASRTPIETSGSLQTTILKIESLKKKSSHTLSLLKHIQSICAQDSTLESLAIKHNDIQLTLAAQNTHTLVTLADSLAQHALTKGMHISCLEPKDQRMIATLKSNPMIRNS